MKKVLLSLAVVLTAGFASAQYYSLSLVNAGNNPGELNNDDEQPSAYMTANFTGYTEILTTGSTGWSAQESIGFDFDFDGTTYSSYYADAGGVVTFESTVGASPGSTPASLPSADIPANSVCAWGLNVTGANDGVITKTFGTAPNRQHWVIWASASSSTLGAGWAYWGIVLEETSNKVFVVDMRSYSQSGGNVELTVGIQFDSTSAMQISGSPTIGSYNTATGGSEFTAVDNTYYSFNPGTQPATDAQMSSVFVPKVVTSTQGGTITGSVTNWGSNDITAWDVIWTDGTSTNTESYTNTISNSGGSANFTHSDQISLSAGDQADITVYVVATGDADNSNDTLWGSTSGASFWPTTAVLGEEGTGTWCGWCPRGAVYMEYMEDTYGDSWIGVAVHNGDPMTNSTYNTWMGTKIGGYPSGLVGRDGTAYDPSGFEVPYVIQVNEFGWADLDVTAEMDENDVVTVDISADFAVTSSADFRLAALVIEDNVTGTTSDYNQVNYYSGGANGAMGGYENLPATVPAADMVYNDVGRELLGGIDGDAGSVPSSVIANDNVTYSYTFTKDGDWDISNLRVAAILLDNTTGAVLNGTEDHNIDYEYTDGGEDYAVLDGDTFELWDGEWVPLGTEHAIGANISLYPNPANDVVTINGVTGVANVKVFDAMGRLVINQNLSGNALNVSALEAGYYNVMIENAGVKSVSKITVVH